MNRIRLLWSFISHYKYMYALGILFIVLTNWIAVTIPDYIRLSIDLLETDLVNQREQLNEYVLIMALLAAFMIVVRTFSRVLFFNPGRAIECRIKERMFHKLMSFQREYYDENSSGTIISRINNDINGVRLLCGFGMMQVFNIASSLSLTPIMMYRLSPELTLYCVIPIVLVFFIVRYGMHFMVTNMKQRMIDLQELSNETVSTLSGIDIVKYFNMQGWVENQFNVKNHALLDRSLNIAWARCFLMPVLNNLENILKTLILFIGGIMVIQQEFTIGELTAFIAYAALLTMPLMGLGWVTTAVQQGLVGLSSVETILNRTEQHSDENFPTVDKPEHLFDQGLRVQNLSFRYSPQGPWVLKDISFEIKPGQTLGILGPIGSGKSTLVNCLNRYLPVEHGSMYLGDQDLKTLRYAEVRSLIRTVTQDPFLFSATVKDNVLFGVEQEEEVKSEELWQVMEECALKSEVQRFPLREQTLVGEKGIMLSGGQKQRISLARAMLAPCDVLILDNVLSAVDYDTERYLLNQIYKRRHARGLIIVSHRATALQYADNILVLNEGKMVDQGTHEELITRPGHYQQTWNLQKESAA